ETNRLCAPPRSDLWPGGDARRDTLAGERPRRPGNSTCPSASSRGGSCPCWVPSPRFGMATTIMVAQRMSMQIFSDALDRAPGTSSDASDSPSKGPRIFSIGHSNHALARLIQLLQAVGVTAVADVRTHPFSQRHPHFNRPELEQGLKASGIGYLFFGDSL